MYLAKVTVTLRRSILDPQGKAVYHAVESLGMSAVREIRMGKYIEMKIDCASEDEAGRITREACTKLLANPVMEDYTFLVERI